MGRRSRPGPWPLPEGAGRTWLMTACRNLACRPIGYFTPFRRSDGLAGNAVSAHLVDGRGACGQHRGL